MKKILILCLFAISGSLLEAQILPTIYVKLDGTAKITYDGGKTWDNYEMAKPLPTIYVKQDGNAKITYDGGKTWKAISLAEIQKAPVGLSASVHPNPGKDVLYFSLPPEAKGNVEITFYTIDGKVAYQGKENGNSLSVNVSNLPVGTYTYRIGVAGGDMYQGTFSINR
ncbi:MAG TPA: T9SS type A sorting domain-containing protein [Patescibacteria group bacterium]|nr:T9SS type A sorting domain-containing protein [Patescibacteria group bacterium]